MRGNKWLRVVAMAVVPALALVGCGGGDDSSSDTTDTSATSSSQPAESSGARLDSPETITVTAGLQGLPYLPFLVAQEEGMFEDNNLTVKLVEVAGTNAVTAVAAGQADVTITLPENIVNARAQGSDLKIIGATVSENLYRLYVGDDIKTLDDLAGKNLGMFNEGNGTDIQLRWLLDEEGGGSDKSTFVAVGGLSDRLAAVQNDQVAGSLLFPPFDVQADRAGLRELAAMKDFVAGYPNEVVAVSEGTITDRPEVLRAFLDALVKAGDFIKENPDRSIELVATASGTDVDVIEEAFEFMKDTFAYDGRVNREGLQWTIDVVKDYASLPVVPTVDDLYDDSLLPAT